MTSTNHNTGVFPRPRAAFFSKLSLALVCMCVALTGATTSAFADPPKAPELLEVNVEGPQVFRFKFRKDARYKYNSRVVQSKTTDAPNLKLPVATGTFRTAFKGSLLQSVKRNYNDGSGLVETSYEQIKIKMQQGEKDISDNAVRVQNVVLNGTKALRQFNPQGEKINAQIMSSDPKGAIPSALPDSLVGTTLVFPEEGIEVGDTWDHKFPVKLKQGVMAIELQFKISYKFLGYTDLHARRTAVFQSEIFMILSNIDQDVPGHQTKLSGSGKGSGYLYFDQKEGVLLRSDVETVQKFETSIQASNKPARSINTYTINSTFLDLTEIH